VLADLMFDYGGYNEEKVKLNITKDMVEKYLDKYKESSQAA
jgi:hypothetical protein